MTTGWDDGFATNLSSIRYNHITYDVLNILYENRNA